MITIVENRPVSKAAADILKRKFHKADHIKAIDGNKSNTITISITADRSDLDYVVGFIHGIEWALGDGDAIKV